MKTPENIKIKRRLVGLKRLPTLIEINNYKCPVPMYYVFRLDPVTRDTKLLSLTVTDSWGHRVKYDVYSTLGLNTGHMKETSLVVLLEDLVSTNKSKVTYPKGTLSASHKITLEYVRAGNNAITYKLLADDEFCAFVNLKYLGVAQMIYAVPTAILTPILLWVFLHKLQLSFESIFAVGSIVGAIQWLGTEIYFRHSLKKEMDTALVM